MPSPLLPNRFLFQFSVPCKYRKPIWSDSGIELSEEYRLVDLAGLERTATNVDMRAAWNEEGLLFQAGVSGKRQPPWCRASRPDDSDGVHLWIDTRNVRNVHRAGRFCHQFYFLPTGSGPNLDQPVADWLPINRAKEQPRPVIAGQLDVRCTVLKDGYRLQAFVSAKALTGFDPVEYPQLGFTYAVIDRELGEQTFGPGSPLPYREDPSLWATLELAR